MKIRDYLGLGVMLSIIPLASALELATTTRVGEYRVHDSRVYEIHRNVGISVEHMIDSDKDGVPERRWISGARGRGQAIFVERELRLEDTDRFQDVIRRYERIKMEQRKNVWIWR